MDHNDVLREERNRHVEELRNRIKACTRDELEIICDAVAENDYDILLGAIYKKIRINEDILKKLADISKGDTNGK